MAKNSPFHVIFGFFRQKSEKTAKNSGSEKNELHRRPSLSHSQWLNGEYATLIGRGAALCEGVYARRNEPCLFSSNLAIFLMNIIMKIIYFVILNIFCMYIVLEKWSV